MTNCESRTIIFFTLLSILHSPLSIHGGYYYLHGFRDKLDGVLEATWKEFKKSHWKISHRVRATNRSDEDFTKQYALLSEE